MLIVKTDEAQFLIDIYEKCKDSSLSPRDVINESDFYMHPKRAWYILSKWSKKDWYGWGVTLDLGWLTANGIQKAKNLLNGGRSNDAEANNY